MEREKYSKTFHVELVNCKHQQPQGKKNMPLVQSPVLAYRAHRDGEQGRQVSTGGMRGGGYTVAIKASKRMVAAGNVGQAQHSRLQNIFHIHNAHASDTKRQR